MYCLVTNYDKSIIRVVKGVRVRAFGNVIFGPVNAQDEVFCIIDKETWFFACNGCIGRYVSGNTGEYQYSGCFFDEDTGIISHGTNGKTFRIDIRTEPGRLISLHPSKNHPVTRYDKSIIRVVNGVRARVSGKVVFGPVNDDGRVFFTTGKKTWLFDSNGCIGRNVSDSTSEYEYSDLFFDEDTAIISHRTKKTTFRIDIHRGRLITVKPKRKQSH